jgi:hypothetical protein
VQAWAYAYLYFQLKSHEHDSCFVVLLDELWVLRPTPQGLLLLKMIHEVFQVLEKRPGTNIIKCFRAVIYKYVQ